MSAIAPKKTQRGFPRRISWIWWLLLSLMMLAAGLVFFWVAALILALLKLPDFLTPIHSISESLKKLAPEQTGEESAAAPTEQSGETG